MREYFFSKGLIVPQAEKNQNLCAFIGLEWKALNLLGFVIELVWRLRFFLLLRLLWKTSGLHKYFKWWYYYTFNKELKDIWHKLRINIITISLLLLQLISLSFFFFNEDLSYIWKCLLFIQSEGYTHCNKLVWLSQ